MEFRKYLFFCCNHDEFIIFSNVLFICKKEVRMNPLAIVALILGIFTLFLYIRVNRG